MVDKRQDASDGPPKNRRSKPPVSDEDKRRARADRFSKPKPQSYGFISRGEDTRLQKSAAARHELFNEIVSEFVAHCNSTQSYQLTQELQQIVDGAEKTEYTKPVKSIENILLSLRKLRESLVALPPDQFTVDVYLFSIRVAATSGIHQTYVPSIYFLLQDKPSKLLTKAESAEVYTLLVLHLAHFSGLNTKAVELFWQNLHPDTRLQSILTAWHTGDFYTWTRLYNAETDHARAQIMKFGVDTMVGLMVRAIGKSYFTLDRQFLRQLLPHGKTEADLPTAWRPENNTMVIRQRK